MYKLYSNRGNIIVAEEDLILFVCNAVTCRAQIIDGIIYIYDISDKHITSKDKMLSLGTYENVIGATEDDVFESNEDFYNYFTTLNDYGIEDIEKTVDAISEVVTTISETSTIISETLGDISSATTTISDKITDIESTLDDVKSDTGNIKLALGSPSDVAAVSEEGSSSEIALLKNLVKVLALANTNLSNTYARLADYSQKAQIVDSAGVATHKKYVTFTSIFTRPNNMTPYTAGDVVGDQSGNLMPLLDSAGGSDIVRAIAAGFEVKEVKLRSTDTSVAGTKARIHFYRDSVDVIADNAPFVFNDANITKRIRYVDVVFGASGSNAKIAVNDYNPFIVNPTARKCYPVIEWLSGGTPSSNSTVWILEVTGELSN